MPLYDVTIEFRTEKGWQIWREYFGAPEENMDAIFESFKTADMESCHSEPDIKGWRIWIENPERRA